MIMIRFSQSMELVQESWNFLILIIGGWKCEFGWGNGNIGLQKRNYLFWLRLDYCIKAELWWKL